MSSGTLEEARANAGAGLSLEVGDDAIAIIEFDQPGAEHNRFTAESLERFVALLDEVRELADDGEVRGLVICSGKPASFIAGMDVETIASVTSAAAASSGARQGQLAFVRLAGLPITSVAAINGTCLGGATELALACDYRVAADSPDVQIGLPEVTLGIIPAFGGSQRLPRLLALERALPMILTGRSTTARRACRLGLIDVVVPPSLLLHQGRVWAAKRRRRPGRAAAPEDRTLFRRLRRNLLDGNPIGRGLVLRQAGIGVRAATKGHYPAPVAALDAIRRGLRTSLDRALKIEADVAGPLIVSEVAKNLMGIFFLRQAARRGRGAGDTLAPPVRRVGVVGAGIMGGGIAQLAAYKRLPVRIKDIAIEPLELAMGVAYKRFAARRRSGRINDADVRRGMELISPTLAYEGFHQADLVIEAVVEKLEVKHRVLADVEQVVGPATVIATNTSSLTLSAMAPALRDPSRFVGLHFFNPVHRMPLVEVVRGRATSDATVARATAFAVAMGKVPVVVGDAPGFFVNRVLGPYLNEALLLLEEGVSIGRIDQALVGFGMPMGPLRLLDEVGLDVSAKVSVQLAGVYGDRIPSTTASARLVESGRLGRKNGRGFYRYTGKGKPLPEASVERLLGSGGKQLDAETIVERCVLVTLNEACHALFEGVVDSPQAADLAMVMGTGFAPFRGGIFRYADSCGLAGIADRLRRLAKVHGSRFEPAESLTTHASEGSCFYDEAWPRRLDSL